jgi:hypothetical protein
MIAEEVPVFFSEMPSGVMTMSCCIVNFFDCKKEKKKRFRIYISLWLRYAGLD